MTLHRRIPDDSTLFQCWKPVHVPAGWQIADGSADDVRVCAAHPWQSTSLVFADGYAYGTALSSLHLMEEKFLGGTLVKCTTSSVGNAQFAQLKKFAKKIEIPAQL
jgi:hypothetical protein